MPGPLEALNLPSPVQSDRPAETKAAALQWLSQGQESEWDSFVARHLWGSLYHTSEWKRVIEQAFPHIRGGFVVLREGAHGEIRAGLPVYRVKSWLLGKRLENGTVVPLVVKVGDHILFGKYSGTDVTLDGEVYLMFREDDVLGIVER